MHKALKGFDCIFSFLELGNSLQTTLKPPAIVVCAIVIFSGLINGNNLYIFRTEIKKLFWNFSKTLKAYYIFLFFVKSFRKTNNNGDILRHSDKIDVFYTYL